MPPATPKQYTFAAVERMDRILRCCKMLIAPSSNAAVSADKIMSDRSTVQTYATWPAGAALTPAKSPWMEICLGTFYAQKLAVLKILRFC